MLFALAAFAGVLVIFIGAYWLFILMPEREAEGALKRRLKPVTAGRADRIMLMRRIVPLSTVPALETMLRHTGSLAHPAQALIQQSGLNATVGHLVLASIFTGVVAYAFGWWMTRSILVGAVAGVLCTGLPWVVVRFIARRRIRKFEEQFPEAIDLIARALRAGHAFTTGLSMVADEMSEPVRGEFRLLYDQQNYGMPMPDALRAFAYRVPLLDARFFVTAVLTQRESGGNLSEVLGSLSALIRDRFRLKRQVRVLSAHGRITGMVLACLPFAIGGLLFLIAPDHIAKLFTDPIGVRMLIVVSVLQVIGFVAMRRIVDIEI